MGVVERVLFGCRRSEHEREAPLNYGAIPLGGAGFNANLNEITSAFGALQTPATKKVYFSVRPLPLNCSRIDRRFSVLHPVEWL